MKTDLFQSCGHCWIYQICWHVQCSTFTESFFRIWNSSTGIPSPPLALFIVMLLRPTWLHVPGCLTLGEWSPRLSGLWRPFLYSSSVYSCHLFLISSSSVRSLPFPSFIEPFFAWTIPKKISNFLEEISRVCHSILFFYSFYWLLRKAFLSLLAIL